MKNRKEKKGFTLIELMVVIFIVGILSAVAIPFMRGRADASKWTEGKSGAGSVCTAAKAFCAEKGPRYDFTAVPGNGTSAALQQIGFAPGDITGRFFSDTDYSITFNGYNDFEVTVVANSGGSSGEPPSTPVQIVMDEAGRTTVTP